MSAPGDSHKGGQGQGDEKGPRPAEAPGLFTQTLSRAPTCPWENQLCKTEPLISSQLKAREKANLNERPGNTEDAPLQVTVSHPKPEAGWGTSEGTPQVRERQPCELGHCLASRG